MRQCRLCNTVLYWTLRYSKVTMIPCDVYKNRSLLYRRSRCVPNVFLNSVPCHSLLPPSPPPTHTHTRTFNFCKTLKSPWDNSYPPRPPPPSRYPFKTFPPLALAFSERSLTLALNKNNFCPNFWIRRRCSSFDSNAVPMLSKNNLKQTIIYCTNICSLW